MRAERVLEHHRRLAKSNADILFGRRNQRQLEETVVEAAAIKEEKY